jgi:hypothetical protein
MDGPDEKALTDANVDTNSYQNFFGQSFLQNTVANSKQKQIQHLFFEKFILHCLMQRVVNISLVDTKNKTGVQKFPH